TYHHLVVVYHSHFISLCCLVVLYHICISFFFHSYGAHRDLHSFPTRRSSDLLRDFIGIRVNRAKKSGMVNITSSVNSRERSGINTILHELNPLFTINVTMRDIKSKNVYSRVNSKATTQWRKTESANG